MSCMVCNKVNYMIPSFEVVLNDTELQSHGIGIHCVLGTA